MSPVDKPDAATAFHDLLTRPGSHITPSWMRSAAEQIALHKSRFVLTDQQRRDFDAAEMAAREIAESDDIPGHVVLFAVLDIKRVMREALKTLEAS